ncbi:MAG: hypothetical protein ACREQY_15315 [Candidatus Binatia bacterium]
MTKRAALLALSAFLLIAPFPARASGDSDAPGAIAACRKHVESMFREAAATSYDGDLAVERVDVQTLRVAGGVTSRSVSGSTTRADFRCQAKRHGLIWTTRTELVLPR